MTDLAVPEINLMSGAFWAADPHEALAWLRNNDPVYWDDASEVWGITRYDHVREVSKDPDRFSNAGGIRPGNGPVPQMIDMDDPAHWLRRKQVNRGFTPARVRAQEDGIRLVTDRLIDAVGGLGRCDFVADIAAWLPLKVIGDALGVDDADHPKLLEWSDTLMRGQGGSGGDIEAMMQAFMDYNVYAQQVIDARRAEPRQDLMSVLIGAEVDGDRLSDEEIIYESLLILIGGDETTRHVITGGVWQLLRTGQWDRLLEDRSLISGAVEEMLRWVSPIKNMARTVTRDIDFHGKTMLAGQKLLLLYPSANRDVDRFEDPFRFDVTRAPNDHVAFGFGSHFCLGNSLARSEIRIVLEQLLERLPDLHLVDEAEPENRAANFVSGYEQMEVAFTPIVASPA
jgi:cytochrome P450 family 142 subfamily A polypeptide 1